MSNMKDSLLVFCMITLPLISASQYIVALIDGKEREYLCVGTVIHEYYVVTAGHCVKHRFKKYAVIPNTSNFTLNETDNVVAVADLESLIEVASISCEEDDIAVLRLASAINYEPIELNGNDTEYKNGFINRWDRKTIGNETLFNSESIPIEIYDSNTCRQVNEKKSYIYNNICGAPTINASLVFGDSGSPLFTQNGKKLVLIGILYCGDVINATFPAAFTKISLHYKWIVDLIEFNRLPPTETNDLPSKLVIAVVSLFLIICSICLCIWYAKRGWKVQQNKDVTAKRVPRQDLLAAVGSFNATINEEETMLKENEKTEKFIT